MVHSVQISSPRPTARPADNKRVFVNHANTQEAEDAYDFVKYRNGRFTSVTGSIAHIVKGALGGGILSGHVAYMKAGIAVAIPLNILTGCYMGFCLYLLVTSAQILCKRTRVPMMSYSDVGEAALSVFPNPKVQKYSKLFRYTIDAIICLDLFGSCACYQIIIAKTIKHLVEVANETIFEGRYSDLPSLRVYIAIMIPIIICICLIRHLRYLAPLSIVANFFIVLCMVTSAYYAFHNNPKFSNLALITTPYGILEFVGMSVFSMSCSGVVLPVENNMKDPKKFPRTLAIGMMLIVCFTFMVSFFGYAAFLNESESPITINFPRSIWCNFLKGMIALMIYVTHALNFWVPFDLCFVYIKPRVNPTRRVLVELICRATFVTLIGFIALIFPDITALMGFIGSFCLSNMAFIWPNVIALLVIYERPGMGKYKWRLCRSVAFIAIGVVLFVCGSFVTTLGLIDVLLKANA